MGIISDIIKLTPKNPLILPLLLFETALNFSTQYRKANNKKSQSAFCLTLVSQPEAKKIEKGTQSLTTESQKKRERLKFQHFKLVSQLK